MRTWWAQVRAEWVKTYSLRTTWVCVGLVVLISVGLGALISWVSAASWVDGSVADRLQYDPVRTAQSGVLAAQFVAGVLGVLLVTSEYSSKMITVSLSAVRTRSTLVSAKLFVTAMLVLAVGEVVAFSSYFVSRAVLLSQGGRMVAHDSAQLQLHSVFLPVLSLSDSGVLRATAMAGVYLALLSMLGVALGFLLRSGAGAISVFVGGLLLLPIIVQLLGSTGSHINPFLPTNLGSAMMVDVLSHNAYGGDFLSWDSALGWLGLYVVVTIALGTWRLVRSDVGR
jgi:hypothetical protein